MIYAMYCENGHRIAFVDPNTGERENPYYRDFNAIVAPVVGQECGETGPIPLPKFCADCGAKNNGEVSGLWCVHSVQEG